MIEANGYSCTDRDPVQASAMLLNKKELSTSLSLSLLTFVHDILEHLELAGRIEGDQVHAPVPTEVPPVEPVPVLDKHESLFKIIIPFLDELSIYFDL